MKKIILILAVSMFAISCGSTRVVFVDTDADLVRLGPDVSGRVYVLTDGSWTLSKKKVRLPEGWYAGGIPKEEE